MSSGAGENDGREGARSGGAGAGWPAAPLGHALPVVERIRAARRAGVVLTCEHASNALWDLDLGCPRDWPEEDRHVSTDHWAYDPGAAELTRLVAHRLGLGAVLAGFSRLQCDPNRDLHEPSLMRSECDGHELALNRGLSAAGRLARIDALWRPYHAATEALVRAHTPRLVLSFHSFTPCYEGRRREVQVGVLHHDDDSPLPRAFLEAFRAASGGPLGAADVRFNEPWPGTVMYGPDRCAAVVGALPLELELRNDLVTRPDVREWAAGVVESVLRAHGLLEES